MLVQHTSNFFCDRIKRPTCMAFWLWNQQPHTWFHDWAEDLDVALHCSCPVKDSYQRTNGMPPNTAPVSSMERFETQNSHSAAQPCQPRFIYLVDRHCSLIQKIVDAYRSSQDPLERSKSGDRGKRGVLCVLFDLQGLATSSLASHSLRVAPANQCGVSH